MIDQATSWLKQHGFDLGRMKQSAIDRIEAVKERLSGQVGRDSKAVLSPAAQRLRDRVGPDQAAQNERRREQEKDREGPER
jgi:hypothetical protein